VWQDFAMACAIYPQEAEFAAKLAAEAHQVVRRLRQHPCIAMWAGDNECDQGYVWGTHHRDPNDNILTRKVLPGVLQVEDPGRPYLPSSPYMDRKAFELGDEWIPENHPWGPRNYYKSPYYMQQVLHFASEIGVHGCPSPESLRKFISPDKVWPYTDNDEWILHSTSPQPGVDLFDYRVMLMDKQVRELFGTAPDNIDDYAFASQAVQAEAKKFFIELFRSTKWRRTGILWWNLMDGWPQLSDAVVDYYFDRKLAYEFIRRAQRPVGVVVCEPDAWDQRIVACNETRDAIEVDYAVRDIDTGETVAAGHATAAGDAVTHLATIPWTNGKQRFYVTEWSSALGACRGHYLSGHPPFDLEQYRAWLRKAGLIE
jgi:beta-mannosidase